MDSKGLLNIEYVFCIIIGILILITLMPLLDDNLNANIELNEEASARILLDNISGSINEVNSNSYGFIKRIDLMEKIANHSYKITVKSNEVDLEFNNKKGKTQISPIKLVNANNESLDEIELYSGNSYSIEKILVDDHQTKLFNQSSILIRPMTNIRAYPSSLSVEKMSSKSVGVSKLSCQAHISCHINHWPFTFNFSLKDKSSLVLIILTSCLGT